MIESTLDKTKYVEKLKLLIDSNDIINIELAVQIMTGSGVPVSMLGYIYALSIFHKNKVLSFGKN